MFYPCRPLLYISSLLTYAVNVTVICIDGDERLLSTSSRQSQRGPRVGCVDKAHVQSKVWIYFNLLTVKGSPQTPQSWPVEDVLRPTKTNKTHSKHLAYRVADLFEQFKEPQVSLSQR